MKVGLTYNMKREDTEESQEPPGGVSVDSQAEWDAPETIAAISAAIGERHDVILIDAAVDAAKDAWEVLRKTRPDIVFNIAEGSTGPCREGYIPSILEHLGIPYTASDPLTLNICLDKSRTKEILAYHGIPTARFRVITGRDDHCPGGAPHYPLVVKPLYEGSSKGIYDNSLVRTRGEMIERTTWLMGNYRQPALVEEFLPGREFTVAILGNGDKARALPIVEILFDSLPEGGNPIYSFEAKWVWDQSSNPLRIFECPARLDEKLKTEIENLCLDAYRVLRCRDWCRVDVRLDAEGLPHILELNPLPGVLPQPEDNSCFPKAARAAGMGYNQLINAVLDIACERYGLRP
ncbi:MAG: ATP-grasp domain-containing protein [Acidobacteriota bacterium]|jgi:D-alanine-D-alanine ligase|nr:ATP-grasp domain-containing protein [Acidobacteriota bacterium]